jgi:hypothetical protein
LATSERLLVHIAKEFGVSEDELLEESLLVYLKSKKEHPSWEDLIVIENLEEKIKRLDKEIGNIESLSGT